MLVKISKRTLRNFQPMGIAIRGMESEQSVDQQVCETTAVADCSCGRVDPVRLSGAG